MTTLTKVSAAVLALGLTQVASANEALTVYGKANLSLQAADEGEGNFTELKSNASRFGIKGGTALNDALEVFYTFEWQVDLADLGGDDNLKSRNQFLGLKGNFGELTIGRRDTVLKEMSKPLDMFNDYEGDLKGLWKGENRMGDSLSYYSPSFSGVKFGVTYITEDSVNGSDGLSAAVSYGDKKLKKSKLYAFASMDSEVKGYDVTRVGVQTKLAGVVVGAMYHEQEKLSDNSEKDGYLVSAAYAMNKFKFKAQLQELDGDESYSLGADYKLGSKTKAYAFYTDRVMDEGEDKSWLAVGLEHKF